MATRIKDGIIPYTGGQGIEITNNHVINVLLREMNNLIQVNGDRELYVDLQLPDGIQPSDTFPVGVTTGKILQEDGWQQSGIILNWKTTSGDYVRLIYANDGKFYIDKGTGQREKLKDCDCIPYTAGEGIEISDGIDYSAMRGPCPDGFHIPTPDEAYQIYRVGLDLGAWWTYSTGYYNYLKYTLLTPAGRQSYDNPPSGGQAVYWTCQSTRSGTTSVPEGQAIGYTINSIEPFNCTQCLPIRPYKDTPVKPNSTWITLFDGSSTASGAGIFWNPLVGLVSLSSDGENWMTTADKNVGATTVWQEGDTVTTSNSGLYYQRGNNYGFPPKRSGESITTTSVQVDTTGYGPGNYYSNSSLYDGPEIDWSNPTNHDLRGRVTGVVTKHNVINNTGVLSVNGETGHIAIEESNTKTFYFDNNSDIAIAQQVYDWYRSGKNPLIYSLINTKAELYGISTVAADSITFQSIGDDVFANSTSASVSTITKFYITIHFTSDVVTSISNGGGFIYVLQTNQNYGIPYTPQYAGSPATKKYVDDSINSVSAKVDSTAPSNPTTGQLWYDTVNSTLNVYDGSSWQTV